MHIALQLYLHEQFLKYLHGTVHHPIDKLPDSVLGFDTCLSTEQPLKSILRLSACPKNQINTASNSKSLMASFLTSHIARPNLRKSRIPPGDAIPAKHEDAASGRRSNTAMQNFRHES
ncbi:Os02g0231925 [Oryza sativa Japonica Group]|uniref:Uncharacterized protein n=2 Tax=Oryza sativa subsp. japonica TaxID=39947 RepID=Q6EUG9_ORYSJ|nr:hypothetical protein [Oryza sativa Japonica Group]BAD28120.1 hypothetical protein [Oryza sativa Japonica Group]BAS77782.1 Os02g0231925 [Oryza sativa Japonica Group]